MRMLIKPSFFSIFLVIKYSLYSEICLENDNITGECLLIWKLAEALV